MPQKIVVRQVVEIELLIDDSDPENVKDFDRDLKEGFLDGLWDHSSAVGVNLLVTEVVSRDHTTNYSIAPDTQREVFVLYADGEAVYEHRDRSEVIREWGRRTDTEVTFSKLAGYSNEASGIFFDYGDPDKFWERARTVLG